MVKNGCSHSGNKTPKFTYLKKEWMEWTDFLHAGLNSQKLKAISMVNNRRDHLVDENLKSAVS